MRILHITAHLGGGAGKAISGIAIEGRRSFADIHQILLLQEPEKSRYVRECTENGVAVSIWNGGYEAIQWADVAVVSWWNHPAMARFLRGFPPIKIPLVLWCHVNGCHYPILPYQFASEFDKPLFTSPYSLENPTWTQPERQTIRAQGEIVWGIGRFDPAQITPAPRRQTGDDFTVGYVGTLNYGKIHPEFVSYCEEVCKRIPAARFVMVGDRDETLERDVRLAGLSNRFTFSGFVKDVPKLAGTFDVFGYLLNPQHYGTTENALLEAMALGLPVVAMRQNVEQYIIPAGAGCLVENAQQYGEQMAFLWRNPTLREKMGRRARACVQECYDGRENARTFQNACCQAAKSEGKIHSFDFLGDSPWKWFLYFLDERNRELFQSAWADWAAGGLSARESVRGTIRNCAPILKEERKSSLRHFSAVYPENEALQIISNLLEQ